MMLLKSEDGAALISVLWGLLVLSIISMTVLGFGLTNRSITSNNYENQKVKYALDAAIQTTLDRLSGRNASRTIPNGVSNFAHNVSGVAVKVSLIPEEGKIDLNGADPVMISGLLAYHGLSDYQARSLEDWMEKKRSSPDGQQFRTVEELTDFPDFPVEYFACVEPYLTVHSGRDGIDMALATDEMVQFIKWADAERWGGENWLNTDGSSTGKFVTSNNAENRQTESYSGKVFTILSSVEVEKEQVVIQKAISRITGNIREPYWIYKNASIYRTELDQCKPIQRM